LPLGHAIGPAEIASGKLTCGEAAGDFFFGHLPELGSIFGDVVIHGAALLQKRLAGSNQKTFETKNPADQSGPPDEG
jgi:hypothetical protein